MIADVSEQSNDTYADYANSFDLSLLHMDNEIDLLTNLQRSQYQPEQKNIDKFDKLRTNEGSPLMNPLNSTWFKVSATPPLSPEYIPVSVYEASIHAKSDSWPTPALIVDHSFCGKQKVHAPNSTASCNEPLYAKQQHLLSPTQDTNSSVPLFPPSPTPSIELSPFQSINIKQESSNGGTTFHGNHYPLSPPDSNGAPSPIGHHSFELKSEPIELAGVDINQFYQNTFDLAANTLAPSQSSIAIDSSFEANDIRALIRRSSLTSASEEKRDHKLLREYLQDTTFQKKHNLKPLALETLFVGDLTARDDIEPMITLALEHARKDVQQTCIALNISAGE